MNRTDPQFLPAGRTTLRPGPFTLAITGPDGLLLTAAVDIGRRGVTGGQFDDEQLKEILAVHSVIEGWIIGQNELRHRQQQLETQTANEGGADRDL